MIDPGDGLEPEISLISGLPFHHATMESALHDFSAVMTGSRQHYWITANVDFATRAPADPVLKDLIFHAHRIYCDGLPLVWLSRWFGRPLPARVAGSDMVPNLLEVCAKEGYRVYFLGSDDATLEEAAKIAEKRWPGLQIAGCHAPPFAAPHQWNNDAITDEIDRTRADLILVAVGCPKQERWISGYLAQTKAKLAIGIGASLDFIAGKQTRAPRWVQRIGFEWFWRMLTDPRRLAKRYLSNFRFLCRSLLIQRRAFRATFGNEGQPQIRPKSPEVALSNETSITPAILGELLKTIRDFRSQNLPPPLVDARNGLGRSLALLGITPPLIREDHQSTEDYYCFGKQWNGSSFEIRAPVEWRTSNFLEQPDLLEAESITIDLSSTILIDYPTLVRLNEVKEVLEKKRIGLTFTNITPRMEGLVEKQGFPELLR